MVGGQPLKSRRRSRIQAPSRDPAEHLGEAGVRNAGAFREALRLKPGPNRTCPREPSHQPNSSLTAFLPTGFPPPSRPSYGQESTFVGACAASAASGTPPLRSGRTRCSSPPSAQGLRMKAAMSAVGNEGGNHAGMDFIRTVSPDTRRAVRALSGNRKRSRGNAGQ